MLSWSLIFEKEVLRSCPQHTAVRKTREYVLFLPCLTATARTSPRLFCHVQFLLLSFCGDSSVSANRQVKIKPSLSQFSVPSRKRPCLSHRHVTRRFDPSCNTIYIVSKSFLRVLKSSKKDENMMSCTILYIESTETLIGQARKKRFLTLTLTFNTL